MRTRVHIHTHTCTTITRSWSGPRALSGIKRQECSLSDSCSQERLCPQRGKQHILDCGWQPTCKGRESGQALWVFKRDAWTPDTHERDSLQKIIYSFSCSEPALRSAVFLWGVTSYGGQPCCGHTGGCHLFCGVMWKEIMNHWSKLNLAMFSEPILCLNPSSQGWARSRSLLCWKDGAVFQKNSAGFPRLGF